MSRQELRAPDAFQRAGAEARAWVGSRQSVVVGAVVVLLLVGFGAALARYVSERSEARARDALSTALAVLGKPVQADLQAGATIEDTPFKTEQERDEATARALTDVRSAHAGSQAAVTATLPLASVELRLGRTDAAIGHFEEYLRRASGAERLRVVALDGLGHASEAKGDLAKALDAYDRMAREESHGFEAGMGAFHRARVLALQGKKQEAAQAFSELVAANAGTPAATLGQERLTALEAEGFKVTPPASKPDAG